MDWLLVAVIVAIVGQFVLIKWLLARHEKRLHQAQRQAKIAKAQLIERAADAQIAAVRRPVVCALGDEKNSSQACERL